MRFSKIVFFIIVFFWSFNIDAIAQGDLSRFSHYSTVNFGKDYSSSRNSLRVKNNKTKTCHEYSFKIDDGKIDSSLYYSVYYYKSGYDSMYVYSGKEPSYSPFDLKENINRDSLIKIGDSIVSTFANKIIHGKDGPCNEITWHDHFGYVIKIKIVCGIINFENTNFKTELLYNSDKQLIECHKRRGRFNGVRKFLTDIQYQYNSKGEIISINYLNKKGKVLGGSKFYYEYWE